VASTTPSCPRCGAAASAGAARCVECGFVFFELPSRRSPLRPSRRAVAAVLFLAAGAAATVVVLSRDEPLAPVPAARAETRLEDQLGTGGNGMSGSVRCPDSIQPGRATRCEFLYPDGDTQLMLVTLMTDGRLDIDVPFPAQRRPGG
jgi:hypothetical protein